MGLLVFSLKFSIFRLILPTKKNFRAIFLQSKI